MNEWTIMFFSFSIMPLFNDVSFIYIFILDLNAICSSMYLHAVGSNILSDERLAALCIKGENDKSP